METTPDSLSPPQRRRKTVHAPHASHGAAPSFPYPFLSHRVMLSCISNSNCCYRSFNDDKSNANADSIERRERTNEPGRIHAGSSLRSANTMLTALRACLPCHPLCVRHDSGWSEAQSRCAE